VPTPSTQERTAEEQQAGRDRVALDRLRVALAARGIAAEPVDGQSIPGRGGRLWPHLRILAPGAARGSVPADIVRHCAAGAQLPGRRRQGTAPTPRDVYVWGPGFEHQASAVLPAGAVLPGPVATAVATSYGRRLGQLPRSAFSPTSVRYRRLGGRRLDRTISDRPGYLVTASLLTASTQLGVDGPTADRRWRDFQVGKVLRDARTWLGSCERCPQTCTGRRQVDVARALCAHYAAVHVSVQHLPERV
jgi:hypothetical protein